MQEDNHAFVARFGNTVIRGSSFEAVGDALVERGFRMVDAVRVGPGEIEIPHSRRGRASAVLKARLPEPTPEPEQEAVANCVCADFRAQVDSGVWPVPTWFCPGHGQVDDSARVDVAGAQLAAAAVMSGAGNPGDFGTRPCGAVHSDGVVCLIGVFVEKVQDCPACGGEIVYHHEGPHEAADEEGVKYRWFCVTVIKDCEFNAYGPMEGEDDDADRM